MLKTKAGIVTIIISSIMGGCGGGGSGSSNQSSAPSSVKVAITEANRKQVAAVVLQSDVRSLSAFSQSAIGVTAVDAIVQKNWSLIDTTKAVLGAITRIPSGQSELPSAIIKQGAIACGDEATPSGSISIEFDDSDHNGDYSAGDSVEFTFNDCLDSANHTTTIGKLKFMFRSAEGQLSKQIAPWSIVADLVYSGLKVRASNRTLISIDGTALWSQNQKSIDESSVTISKASLNVIVTDKEFAISDCAVTFDENMKTGDFRQFGRQTISSPPLGGILETEIVETQALTGNDNAPNSGVIHVVGDKSSLYLTATGSGNVKIELDSNSDGVVESDETVSWVSLAVL